MTLSTGLTGAGLALTLIGSAMLFFRSIWSLEIGNTIVTPDNLVQFPEDATHPDVPKALWEPIHRRFWRRGKLLNNWGFGLLAVGTALQIVGVFM